MSPSAPELSVQNKTKYNPVFLKICVHLFSHYLIFATINIHICLRSLSSCHARALNTFQPLVKIPIWISDCCPGNTSNRYRIAVEYLPWSGCRPVRTMQPLGMWNVEPNNHARLVISGLTAVHVEWGTQQPRRLPFPEPQAAMDSGDRTISYRVTQHWSQMACWRTKELCIFRHKSVRQKHVQAVITCTTHQPSTLLFRITNSFSSFPSNTARFEVKKCGQWKQGERGREKEKLYELLALLFSEISFPILWKKNGLCKTATKATSLLSFQLILPHVRNNTGRTHWSSSTYARPVCMSSVLLIIACFIFVMDNCPVQQIYDMASHQAMPNADKHKIKTKIHLGKYKKENNVGIRKNTERTSWWRCVQHCGAV